MNRPKTLLVLAAVLLMGWWAWHVHHRPPHDTHQPQTAAVVASTPASQPTPSSPVSVQPDQSSQDEEPVADVHDRTDSDATAGANPAAATPMPAWVTYQPTAKPAPPRTSTVTATGTPRGATAWTTANRTDSDAVGIAFVQRYNTRDTTTDTTPWTGPARAASLATPDYAKALTTATATSPDDDWTTLQAHQGWTTVEAHRQPSNEAPADTPTARYRTYTVTITAHGPNGWQQTTHHTQIVLLHHDTAGWRVQNTQILS